MGYRKVTEDDREIIREQISLESYHKGKGFNPDQFYEPDTFAFVFTDDPCPDCGESTLIHREVGWTCSKCGAAGLEPRANKDGDVAYMVVKKIAHCHIQWVRKEGQPDDEQFKERIRKRFTEELPWVMQLLKGNGYKACVYDTKNPGLAWFLRRFGFRTLKDWFINWL